jgi:hypothetical protein
MNPITTFPSLHAFFGLFPPPNLKPDPLRLALFSRKFRTCKQHNRKP